MTPNPLTQRRPPASAEFKCWPSVCAGVFGMVMLEGAAIGVLGLILAAVAGVALGVFWVEVQFPAILGWKLDLHFPTTFALGAAGLTILLCLVGALLPSLRAARLAVPEALRND